MKLIALSSGRNLPPERYLVFFSVKGGVEPRTTVRLGVPTGNCEHEANLPFGLSGRGNDHVSESCTHRYMNASANPRMNHPYR